MRQIQQSFRGWLLVAGGTLLSQVAAAADRCTAAVCNTPSGNVSVCLASGCDVYACAWSDATGCTLSQTLPPAPDGACGTVGTVAARVADCAARFGADAAKAGANGAWNLVYRGAADLWRSPTGELWTAVQNPAQPALAEVDCARPNTLSAAKGFIPREFALPSAEQWQAALAQGLTTVLPAAATTFWTSAELGDVYHETIDVTTGTTGSLEVVEKSAFRCILSPVSPSN